MLRPTPLALGLGLVAFLATAGLALVGQGAGWFSLLPFAGLLLAMLMDASALPRRQHLSAELEVLPYLETGMAYEGALTLSSHRVLPASMRLDLRSAGHGLEVEVLDGVAEATHKSRTWPVRLWAAARGETRFFELRAQVSSALGLVHRQVRLPLDQSTRVNASTRGAKQAALTIQRRGSLFGARAQLAKGQGSEFEAMRDFQNGMDPRLIDWKQTAKRGALIAKEMRLEQNHQVYLVFDTGYLMSTQIDGVSKLDHAINAGLAIGWIASQQGDQVGAYSFDAKPRGFAPAKRGKAGYASIKYELGALVPAAVETNPTFGLTRLRQRLNQRALIIVFTDFVDTTTAGLMVEHLSLMARDHLVIFVTLKDPEVDRMIWEDPASMKDLSTAAMAADMQASRQLVMAQLRAKGLFCLDVAAHQLSTDLLNTYISIRERQLQ